MNVRNSYLISHAFRNYMWASMLTSAATQLTVTIDAIILGHFAGGDALSAISLVMPLTLLVSSFSTLIGVGPAIMASKAIGNRQFKKVNMVFTSAIFQAVIIGGCIGIGCWCFSNDIALLLCNNEHILPYLNSYLQVLPWSYSLTILVSSLISLIEADGHPQLAAKVLVAGSLLHICLEVLFVGYLDMGIQGVAYAMLLNNILVITLFALCMRRQGVSYRWLWPKNNVTNVTISGLKEGMPMMVNDLMYSMMLFLLSGIMGFYFGEQGLFHWAICVQLLMIVLFVVDVAEGAVLSIGGMLIGAKDGKGFSMLMYRLLATIVVVVAVITLFILCFPDKLAEIFSDGTGVSEEWPYAVRAFSLMLVPHALSVFMRSFFQVLNRRWLGMIFSTLQMLCTVLGLWAVFSWAPSLAWWSFPISAFLLLVVQFVVVYSLCRKQSNHSLLPIEESDDREQLELSVEYDTKSVVNAIGQVCEFLESRAVNNVSVMVVNICCEELMLNIVSHQSHKQNPYMDLHIAVGAGEVSMVLKDAGRPFNPVLSSRHSNLLETNNVSLGLTLVNNVCTTLSHKYMYGQNVVFAEFKGGE